MPGQSASRTIRGSQIFFMTLALCDSFMFYSSKRISAATLDSLKEGCRLHGQASDQHDDVWQVCDLLIDDVCSFSGQYRGGV